MGTRREPPGEHAAPAAEVSRATRPRYIAERVAREPVHIYAPSRSFAETLVAALPDRDCEIWDDAAAVLAGLPDARCVVAGSLPPGAAARATQLRWLHALGGGVDALTGELPPAASLVRVTGVCEAAVSEHAWALLLALARELPLACEQQRARVWRPFATRQLAGCTLGVLGLGAIGGRIAALGRSFGMRVLGTRRGLPATTNPGPAEPGVSVHPPDATATVLAAADFVVVALPRTPATRGLLGPELLARMRPGSRLVVISRGGIVDESALIDRLRCGAIAGAALDVAAEEPLPPDSPLWGAPNLLLTPHVAGWSPDYARQVAAVVRTNLEHIAAGRAPPGLVDPARGY